MYTTPGQAAAYPRTEKTINQANLHTPLYMSHAIGATGAYLQVCSMLAQRRRMHGWQLHPTLRCPTIKNGSFIQVLLRSHSPQQCARLQVAFDLTLPRTLLMSAALRYRSRMSLPGVPASSCSSSPALITTASTLHRGQGMSALCETRCRCI